MIYPYES